MAMDANEKPTSLQFNMVERTSPLLIELDIKRYSDTVNTKEPSVLVIKLPTDVEFWMFYRYISEEGSGEDRLRVELAPHKRYTVNAFLGFRIQGREMIVAKCCTG